MKRCKFSLHLSTLSRRKRRNAVQMAAYLIAQPLLNWATKRTFTRRHMDSNVMFEMLGTSVSPEEFFNYVEAAENRDDSMVARTIVVVLPIGIPRAIQYQMLCALAAHVMRVLGTPVLVVMHEKQGSTEEEKNPHGHLLFATREWNERTYAFAAKKNRILDDWRTGGPVIEDFRAQWESILNANLAPDRLSADRRSHARRGEKRLPCLHLGRMAIERERRTGRPAPEREINQLIEEHARHLREAELADLTIEELESRLAKIREKQRRRQLKRAWKLESKPLAKTPRTVVQPKPQIDLVDAADVLLPSSRFTVLPIVGKGTAATAIEPSPVEGTEAVGKEGYTPDTAPHPTGAQPASRGDEKMPTPTHPKSTSADADDVLKPAASRCMPQQHPAPACSTDEGRFADAGDVLIPHTKASPAPRLTGAGVDSFAKGDSIGARGRKSILPSSGHERVTANSLIAAITELESKRLAANEARRRSDRPKPPNDLS